MKKLIDDSTERKNMLSQKVMNGEVSSLIVRNDVNETDPFSGAQHSRATLQSLAMMSILSKRITKLLLEMKLIKNYLFNYSLGNKYVYNYYTCLNIRI